jgi:hypothetical protein
MSVHLSQAGASWYRWRQAEARRRWVAYLAALGAPPAAAAAMVPLRAHAADTALALVMVAVVVLVVTPGRRLAAVVAGVSAGVWFDFFLTQPYESFTISHSADIQTSVLLLVVAAGVGHIAARERHQRAERAISQEAISHVQAVTGLLAGGAGTEEVSQRVCEALVELLHLESCRFDASRVPVTIPYIERPGFVSYAAYRWDATTSGLPVSPVTLPVRDHDLVVGRFVLQGPVPEIPVEEPSLVAAIALADLTALAIGRRARWLPLGEGTSSPARLG